MNKMGQSHNWKIVYLVFKISLFLTHTSTCQQTQHFENFSDGIVIIDEDTLALIPIQVVRQALFTEDNLQNQIEIQRQIIRAQIIKIELGDAIIEEQQKSLRQYIIVEDLFNRKEKIYEEKVRALEKELRNTRIIVYVVSGLGLVALIW